MREIKIRTLNEYSVFVASGASSLNSLLDSTKIKRIFVITDENVYSLYENFFQSLGERVLGINIIKPGEENKSWEIISSIYEELIKMNADKKTAIVSVGGGVVGDLSGFIASTYLRGLTLVHIPTTLTSQCNSSIGGKNGFNFNGIKNIIGTYYRPSFVYTDVNFLKTLGDREYSSGIAEVIKYGFLCDSGLFRYMEENKKGIKEREVDKLLHMVYECARIKGEIEEAEESNSGACSILNFGHTIGNGIESASSLKLLEGEALALGMNIEAHMAASLGYLDKSSYDRLVSLIDYFIFPLFIDYIDIEKVLNIINKDKKKTLSNLKFVLPEKIGHAIITTEIKNSTIRESIDSILFKIRREL